MKVALYAFAISALLMERNLNFASANCENKCEHSSGSVGQTGIKQHAMLGHSFKIFAVKKPYDCHVKCFDEKCWCQAYQIKGSRCELLKEDRFSSPDDFVEEDGYTYFDMNREFAIQSSSNNACSNHPCSNQCCNQSPCAHGGTCKELCDHAKQKFNCTCTKEYYGKYCEKRRATSCKQQLELNTSSHSGKYTLFDPTEGSLYAVYCDFTTEIGFVWTLVESFSLANKNEFANKAFFKDYPLNQNSFNWKRFRLSKLRMNFAAAHSTHVRATCNFNTDGLVTTDYLRAKLSDIDIMNLRFNDCTRYEYINIRGFDCYNCTAHFVQTDNWHAHVDSYHGSKMGCQFSSAFEGAVKSSGGEDNFGWYKAVNPVHRCSSTDNSSTQWWFGER